MPVVLTRDEVRAVREESGGSFVVTRVLRATETLGARGIQKLL